MMIFCKSKLITRIKRGGASGLLPVEITGLAGLLSVEITGLTGLLCVENTGLTGPTNFR